MATTVCYSGSRKASNRLPHGGLPPVAGATHVQVLRANRTRSYHADGFGWTYNHAPFLCHWSGRFWLQYLSSPLGEHLPPCHTLLCHSIDGLTWSRPTVVFPVYEPDPDVYRRHTGRWLPRHGQSVMHQRMGFYVAPGGRLLTLGFHGICSGIHDGPNDGTGVGRVVREVFDDGSFGPIYFIRYNRHAGWHEGNTSHPHYRASADAGFVAACEALLADPLYTLQWWEEDRADDGFFALAGHKAFCWYRRGDGEVVGLWKGSVVGSSVDGGRSWRHVAPEPSLVMPGSKLWGQRTSDGRYALLYNPDATDARRWPLAVVTSDDGRDFDDLLAVNGHVPPMRFPGPMKDRGLQYVRGITEGNGEPPDGCLWVCYSANKEDIWVSRVAVPVRGAADGDVDDRFDAFEPGPVVPGWNVHHGQWAHASVADAGGGRSLRLFDEDPWDEARAFRHLPRADRLEVELRMAVASLNPAKPLRVRFVDEAGADLACITIGDTATTAGATHSIALPPPAEPATAFDLRISLDARDGAYSVGSRALGVESGGRTAAVGPCAGVLLSTGTGDPYRESSDDPDKPTPTATDARLFSLKATAAR